MIRTFSDFLLNSIRIEIDSKLRLSILPKPPFQACIGRSRLHTALNRLTGATLSKSGQANQAYTWTYDQTGGMFSHGIGRLTSITFPEGSTSYAYDAQGRVIQARQILSPNAAANPSAVVHYTAYAYDGAGNPTSVAVNNGTPNTYTVDPASNRLTVTLAGSQPSP
ncbi:MAG: RHS repeat protein [Betaproteobacteria bacterium]|nr:RHS repeat protein [Betaproteobacteria bacterium]